MEITIFLLQEALEEDASLRAFIPIMHARDNIIPLDKRSDATLMKSWNKAVASINCDSRIRLETQRVSGEDMDCWRWIAVMGAPKMKKAKKSTTAEMYLSNNQVCAHFLGLSQGGSPTTSVISFVYEEHFSEVFSKKFALFNFGPLKIIKVDIGPFSFHPPPYQNLRVSKSKGVRYPGESGGVEKIGVFDQNICYASYCNHPFYLGEVLAGTCIRQVGQGCSNAHSNSYTLSEDKVHA